MAVLYHAVRKVVFSFFRVCVSTGTVGVSMILVLSSALSGSVNAFYLTIWLSLW